jgi:hypothetical protein
MCEFSVLHNESFYYQMTTAELYSYTSICLQSKILLVFEMLLHIIKSILLICKRDICTRISFNNIIIITCCYYDYV